MRQVAAIALGVPLAAAAMAQTRFPEMRPEQMNPEQRAMYDAIMAGPRHSMAGPFNAWMRSPVLGQRLQEVGEYLRFKTSVPLNLNEFAILITAVEWGSGFEWYAHYPLAIKAGLNPAVAKDLQDGKRPENMSEDEALVYDFTTQLHHHHQVSDDVYARAVKRLGERGVVDLIALIGYYDLVSATLNVARVLPPAEAGRTLEPPKAP